MTRTNTEIMLKGMDCLKRELGLIDAERFISLVLRENFDYTKWQREYFDAKTPDEISREAEEYAKKHPFRGSAVRV